MPTAKKPNNHWIELAASFTGRGRHREIFIYAKTKIQGTDGEPMPISRQNNIDMIGSALSRAFHLRWSDSFPLIQDRCTAYNSNEKERNGDSALKLLREGLTWKCEILSPLASNIELGKQLREAILKGKLNGLCFVLGDFVDYPKGKRER